MSEELTTKEFLADLNAAKTKVERLQQSNFDKVQALANLGKAVPLQLLANIKVDLFIEMFLDEGAKLLYLHNLETKLRPILDEALAQARQEQIAGTVMPGHRNSHPGLILPR